MFDIISCILLKNLMNVRIGASILNSDLSNLAQHCNELIDKGSDYLHLDVMDGHFVDNITFGHPVIKCLKDNLKYPCFLDGHMMIENPEKWITRMADAGITQYTFHLETTEDPNNCIRLIQESGMLAGLAIKPNTPVEIITEELMKGLNMVLIMTVEPGFGGQKFMDSMLTKVEWLRNLYPDTNISVDGGVNEENIQACCRSGANMLVCGTSLTRSKNPELIIKRFRDII